ncbi:hypothetical protein AB4Z22_09020, partial [Paenibacillus sp. TAF58]
MQQISTLCGLISQKYTKLAGIRSSGLLIYFREQTVEGAVPKAIFDIMPRFPSVYFAMVARIFRGERRCAIW